MSDVVLPAEVVREMVSESGCRPARAVASGRYDRADPPRLTIEGGCCWCDAARQLLKRP